MPSRNRANQGLAHTSYLTTATQDPLPWAEHPTTGSRAKNIHCTRGDEQHNDCGDRRLEAHGRLRTQ
jgi:hypothetical protein